MQSLKTGLRILNEFSRASGELKVTEIANRLGMSKSQVSRMLSTFREEGWVTQNPATRGFSIGVAAYAAGSRFINGNRLTREALPVMRGVVDRCGFTCTLSILDGSAPLYLLGLDGPISADFASRVGSYFPFHSTAPGKLLAAFADEVNQAALLRTDMTRLTSETITDAATMRKTLRAIRERGVAVSRGERTAGIGAIAVPVFDGARSIAALGIAYPQALVPDSKVVDFTALLHARAAALSLRLGAERYPFEPQAPVEADSINDAMERI
jgi:DNA-binding IclR family transcriptional regulator